MSGTTSDLPNWLALQKAKNAADGIGNDNLLTPPPAAARPAWWDNPVGAERLNDTYAGMPSSDVSAVIGAYGAHPVTAAMRGNALDIASAASQFGPADMASIRAFHGSPADFNAFSDKYIGTGEGAQAYGRGHYFGGAESTGEYYRKALGSEAAMNALDDFLRKNRGMNLLPEEIKAALGGTSAAKLADDPQSISSLQQLLPNYLPNAPVMGSDLAHYRYLDDAAQRLSPGHMYEVSLNADPEHMLDWDQTIGTHPDPVRDKLYDMGYGATQRGKDVYMHMSRGQEGYAGASAKLRDAGIPGIKYLDQGSRSQGQGTSNFVIFDPKTIEILRKYGIAGLIGAGAASAPYASGAPDQQTGDDR